MRDVEEELTTLPLPLLSGFASITKGNYIYIYYIYFWGGFFVLFFWTQTIEKSVDHINSGQYVYCFLV